jgi:hypothetical protein
LQIKPKYTIFIPLLFVAKSSQSHTHCHPSFSCRISQNPPFQVIFHVANIVNNHKNTAHIPFVITETKKAKTHLICLSKSTALSPLKKKIHFSFANIVQRQIARKSSMVKINFTKVRVQD